MGGVKGPKTKDPIEMQRREEEKKQKQAQESAKKQGKPEEKAEKSIVRLMATDLDGESTIFNSLRAVKGVSFAMAKAVCLIANIEPTTKTLSLSEEQLQKIEDVVRTPDKHNFPPYLLNQRKDLETGRDRHFTGSELDVNLRQRLSDLMRYGSYRGWRHRLGQPVRGQRTRSSFRKSGSVGVVRAKAKPGAAAAAPAKEAKK